MTTGRGIPPAAGMSSTDEVAAGSAGCRLIASGHCVQVTAKPLEELKSLPQGEPLGLRYQHW
jgi:hypothetical protein